MNGPDDNTAAGEGPGPDDREALEDLLRALVDGRLDVESAAGLLIAWRAPAGPTADGVPTGGWSLAAITTQRLLDSAARDGLTGPGPTPPAPTAADRPGDSNATAAWSPAVTAAVAAGEAGDRADRGRSDGERFELRRFHARGGLGEVYVAHDRQVGRDVALKVIRPELAARAGTRERFLVEAEITGQLEHPGIVPVYGIGADDRGRPYYAMRLIRGHSLLEAIGRFRRGRRWPASLEFRGLIGRFLAVCNAIAYAHSRGVIHRDIKPSNVMLGPFGETIVVDWGLAKTIGGPDPAADGAEAGPPDGAAPIPGPGPARPPSGGSAETVPGSVVGTPAYMSPEQAQGRLDELGPAADVYSLGATLYHLIVGRMPIQAADAGDVLRRVCLGEFERPRRVDRRIPKALEAICLRAMAMRPADRYESALALADDLRRWLADEPVAAHREGWLARLARWSRRNRAWARAAVVALAVVAGVASVAALVVSGALRTAEHARIAAEAAERQARAEGARLTLDRALYLGQLGDVHAGLLWLAEALRADAEAELDAGPTIRANLTSWGQLVGQLDRAIPHPEHLTAVAVAPDGRLVATASHDGFVRLWDPDADRPPIALEQGAPVADVAFGPDGTPFSGDHHGWLIAWDLETRAPRWRCQALEGAIFAIALAPDGRTCAAAGRDGQGEALAQLVDLDRGERIGQPMPHRDAVAILGVAFSPDGRTLATAGHDSLVRTWDAATGTPGPLRLVHPMPVQAVVFAPDGDRLLTGCQDGQVRSWDAATGAEIDGFRPSHQAGVSGLEFRPDGRVLLTVGWDATARIWDAATGRPLGSAMPHHYDIAAGAFFPDGRRFATVANDFVARVWSVPPGPPNQPVLEPGGSIRRVAYRPDGRAFLTCDADGRMQLWDAEDLSPIGAPMHHPGGVARVRFDPTSRRLLTSYDRSMRLWDARTGEPIGQPMIAPAPVFEAHFGAGGQRVVSAGYDNHVRGWDAATGRPTWDPVAFFPDAPSCLALAPDGRTAWIGGFFGLLAALDVETGEPTAEFSVLSDRVISLAISPDDRTALAGCTDGRAVMIALDEGGRLGPVLTHRGPVSWIDFTPDGAVALTESAGVLRRWDARTGRPVGPLLPHRGPTQAMTLDDARLTVLTGYTDGSALAWDVASGKAIGPAMAHRGPVSGVALRPDGSEALTCDGSGTVYRWTRPAPMAGDPARVTLAVEVLTGMALIDGAALRLDLDAWQARRDRLRAAEQDEATLPEGSSPDAVRTP